MCVGGGGGGRDKRKWKEKVERERIKTERVFLHTLLSFSRSHL